MEESQGNGLPRPKRYGLRVKLVSPTKEPVKAKSMTSTESSNKARKVAKNNPLAYANYLEKERVRSRARRASMTPEQRSASNEKTARRMANLRARRKELKEKGLYEESISSKRRSSRLDERILQRRKEYDRKRVQKYRDALTPQKRRRLNEKRMSRYYRKKEEKLENQRKNACGGTGNRNVSECGMSVSENLGDEELRDVGKKTKKKRDIFTIKAHRLLAQSVVSLKRKYKALGFDRRTLKLTSSADTLYKRKSQDAKEVVTKFYLDQSVDLPGVKTV